MKSRAKCLARTRFAAKKALNVIKSRLVGKGLAANVKECDLSGIWNGKTLHMEFCDTVRRGGKFPTYLWTFDMDVISGDGICFSFSNGTMTPQLKKIRNYLYSHKKDIFEEIGQDVLSRIEEADPF